jgi:uncharacterized protein involved in response to NO
MTIQSPPATGRPRGGIPRGLAAEGPALLSHGFRPFFLGAGIFAFLAMLVWIVALAIGLEIGGTAYGATLWHGHEMLFGYSAAALAGFLLTAVPNWTGRLPVSGRPLLLLVLLWVAGRLVMVQPDLLGVWPAALVDVAFLLALAAIVAREIVAGSNWKNLKVLVGVTLLAALNLWCHVAVLFGLDTQLPLRLATGVYVLLVAIVGGRIIPSFTRNYLSRRGDKRLPAPFGRFDIAAIIARGRARATWSILPDWPPVALLALLAAGLNAVRLWRWRGPRTLDEPLVLVLHLAYAFVPIGLVAMALAALGVIAIASALHVLTVGVIGLMTLAVMSRATRGHTGRPLTASQTTTASYLSLLLAAVLRPFAELIGAHYHTLLMLGGAAWLLAFALFVFEHAPMWLTRNPR